MTLPQLLDRFLAKHEKHDDGQLGGFVEGRIYDATWVIKDSGESSGCQLALRGAEPQYIHWSFQIGNHNLLDHHLRAARNHCQKIFAAVVEDVSRPSLSPLHIDRLHDNYLAILEHFAVCYPEEFKISGLGMLTYDRIEAFLADFRRGGISATGRWFERFLLFIEASFSTSEIDLWLAQQRASGVDLFIRASRRVIGLSGAEFTVGVIPYSTELRILRARSWLHLNGWLDRTGRLSLHRIADAIGVDKRRACRPPKRFLAQLRALETCGDYRAQDQMQSEYREYEGVRQTPLADLPAKPIASHTQRQMCTLMTAVFHAMQQLSAESKKSGVVTDLVDLPSRLKGGICTARTPTLPVSTALFAYDRMISWAAYAGPTIGSYLERLVEHLGPEIARPNLRKVLAIAMAAREPPTIQVGAKELALRSGTPELAPRKGRCELLDNGLSQVGLRARTQGLTLIDALQLNVVILAANVGALCLRRVDEIVTLPRDCLVAKEGKTYLRINLGKVGLDGTRATVHRPIPRYLFEALLVHRQLGDLLWSALERSSCGPFPHLFWCLADRRRTLVSLSRVTISRVLAFFCDLIELPLDEKGRRWYIRTHELRRFGAMSFFRISGMENSLPALSWMLGHRDIHRTWRYVQQELTGEELTRTEVAMAHAALMSKQESGAAKGADELAEVVLRHFGTSRLSLIDPDDLDDYLALLRRDNAFAITPMSLRGRDGLSYVIMIRIQRELRDD